MQCQKLALMGKLSSSITHEINNHLTGVSGYAQLLLSQERAKEIARELEKINESAVKCNRIISDFKRLSHSGSGEKEFNNLNLILQSVVNLLRHQFMKKSLELHEAYSEEIPAIEVDTPAIEQVFLNIIQNALEALEDTGSRLLISTLLEDGQIVVNFEDDGSGFSEGAREHLFTPFFTTKSPVSCPGLGLVAAKALVEEHAGSLEVRNCPEGGAHVRIAFPCD